MKKWCPGCRRSRPTSAFHQNKARSDGLASTCKDCKSRAQRSWYERNRSAHIENTMARKRRVVAANRELYWNYLLGHPCVDCGISDPVVLEFDHEDELKVAAVARMLGEGWSWSAIAQELEKGAIRCANCHRRRTAHIRHQWRHDR